MKGPQHGRSGCDLTAAMKAREGWRCKHGSCKRVHAYGSDFCWQHEKAKKSTPDRKATNQ